MALKLCWAEHVVSCPCAAGAFQVLQLAAMNAHLQVRCWLGSCSNAAHTYAIEDPVEVQGS